MLLRIEVDVVDQARKVRVALDFNPLERFLEQAPGAPGGRVDRFGIAFEEIGELLRRIQGPVDLRGLRDLAGLFLADSRRTFQQLARCTCRTTSRNRPNSAPR